MGGDLISDGGAKFWSYRDLIILNIPKFKEKLNGFLKTHKSVLSAEKKSKYEKAVGYLSSDNFNATYLDKDYKHPYDRLWPPLSPIINALPSGSDVDRKFYKLYKELEEKTRYTTAFRNYVEKHISGFYQALEHSSNAGSTVFVIKGDHDLHDLQDFPNAYSVKRINSFENIQEISGKIVNYENLRILGLGYMDTHYIQKLRSISKLYSSKVDVILTHAEQRRMPELACWLKPKIIIRGHFGIGITKIKDVIVLASLGFPAGYAMMELEDGLIESAYFWFYCNKSGKLEKCTRTCHINSCRVEQKKSVWPWQQRIFRSCPLETS